KLRGLWQLIFCFSALYTAILIARETNLFVVYIFLALTLFLFLNLINKWINDFLVMQKILDEKVTIKNIIIDLVVAFIISVLTLANIYVFFNFIVHWLFPQYENYETLVYNVLFSISLLLSIYFALIQPLDNHTLMKMEVIDLNKNKLALQSLKDKLIKKYKRRFGVPIITTILRPFLAIKVFGKENVEKSKFPSIFICNHYELFGPAVSVIFLPFYFRPWVNQELVNKELSFDHIYNNSFKQKKMPDFLKVLISKIEAKLGNWVFTSFDPIPVYKKDIKDVIKTISSSIDALKCGDNLLIFPENPAKSEGGKYETDDVGQFYTGFAHLGRAYFKATGECVTFYPIFVDKDNRSLSIGHGIDYDNSVNPNEEKMLIAKYLHDSLLEMKDNPPRVLKKK
ncbi:MAG: hypothetical protein RR458_00290, partial [Clostridia bacterium]